MTLHPTELYLTIDTIQRRKRDAKIVPDHALRTELFKELKKYGDAGVDLKLRELLNAGRIEAGRTINDTWIRTK